MGFRPPGETRDSVFVVRLGESVRVYRNLCPHQGASLPWRKNAYLNTDGSQIVCCAHGAQFDPATGACVSGPALGQSLCPIEFILTDGMIRARKFDVILK